MTQPTRRLLLAAPALLPLLRVRGLAAQPAWPNGPVRLVVPFPAGGSVDTLARLAQPGLQAAIGAPVVVENRGGASGSIGTAAAARAAPDGQTFVFVFDTHAVNPALIPNLGFDTRRDLQPVMLIGTAPMLITATRGRPWTNLQQVLAAAREKPDSITYGTIGNGSLAHLTMTLMQEQGGFRVTHVPYRGGGPLSAAAAAGEVDLPMATNAGLGGQVGQSVRPLAQTGARRSARFPDLPTVAESGLPGLDALAWWGALAPSQTPAPIVARFHAALQQAFRAPDVQARLAQPLGVDPVLSSPEEFATFLDRQMEIWGAVVRDKGIKSD